MRVLVPVLQVENSQEKVLEFFILHHASCFLAYNYPPYIFYLFLLYVHLKCHICSASIIGVLNDDSSCSGLF